MRFGKKSNGSGNLQQSGAHRNLAGRVAQQIAPDSVSLLKVLLDTEFLAANGFSRENALGMYLPDSYDFFWNTTAENFRDKMWRSYQNFWTDNRENKAAELGLTPLEVMSLAAIVQKETQKADERPARSGGLSQSIEKKNDVTGRPHGHLCHETPTSKF